MEMVTVSLTALALLRMRILTPEPVSMNIISVENTSITNKLSSTIRKFLLGRNFMYAVNV